MYWSQMTGTFCISSQDGNGNTNIAKQQVWALYVLDQYIFMPLSVKQQHEKIRYEVLYGECEHEEFSLILYLNLNAVPTYMTSG